MHLVENNSSMQPTQLWSVGKFTFLHPWCVFINIVFRPCYLFLLWNVVLKCLALWLITIFAAYFLHLYACLTCSSVNASSLHPLLAHHHLCYVDVYCVFFFYFWYMLHFFVTPFWIVCVHIFVWLFFLYHFILAVFLLNSIIVSMIYQMWIFCHSHFILYHFMSPCVLLY